MDESRRGTAVAWATFAAIMMVMVGSIQALYGLSAILHDTYWVTLADTYAFKLDVTTWGWIHFLVGLFVVAAGFGVMKGSVWARTVGVVLAMLSAIGAFLTIPYQPLWSSIVIALDVAVIWGLTNQGGATETV